MQGKVGASGPHDISIAVGGVQLASQSQGCPDGGCGMTSSATLDPTQYRDGGRYQVVVQVTDGAGEATTEQWSILIRRMKKSK